MISISTTQKLDETREALFSIDGEEYTIPVHVPPVWGLQATEVTRQQGEIAATAWIMEKLLGAKGWRVLRECEYSQAAQLSAIVETCRTKVFGAMEEEGKG